MEMEVKVLSCKGLTAFNFFQKLTIYAAVSITSDDKKLQLTQQQIQEQKTPVDDEGEGNPEWDHLMKFDLLSLKSITSSFEHLSVLFEFRHHGQFFGDKTIGTVRVPLRTLIESVGVEVVRFVSYEVRSPEGKHNGILDFSYKVIGVLEHHSSINPEFHISGYHHHHHNHHLGHSHGHGTNSDVNNTGYQTHNGPENRPHLDQYPTSEPEKIQYPKIELDGWSANNAMTSAASLVGGNENESAYQFIYPPPSSSSTTTALAPYPPPPAIYPPPRPQLWGPLPPPPYDLPPPPPLPPVVYPAPPPPYGDPEPHWVYHRPPEYQQPSGEYDHYHHW